MIADFSDPRRSPFTVKGRAQLHGRRRRRRRLRRFSSPAYLVRSNKLFNIFSLIRVVQRRMRGREREILSPLLLLSALIEAKWTRAAGA